MEGSLHVYIFLVVKFSIFLVVKLVVNKPMRDYHADQIPSS